MKRYFSILSLAAAVAGCGGGNGGKVDLGGNGSDGTGGMVDMTGGGTQDLTMTMMGAPTGDPCTKATDCGGSKPNCITKDMTGTAWPGGYCTSSCNPSKNDQQTGLNPACPGGAATCSGSGTMGTCVVACTGAMGNMPCPRTGYSCFVIGTTLGCEPTAYSQCDPTVKGSCPQDGGSFDDAGTYSGRVCVPIGDDPVGECVDGCDPFKQNCPAVMGNVQGCYATFKFGEGNCSQPFGGGKDGTACSYLNSCDPGFGCHPEANNTAFCRPYCGGPNNVMCNNGKKCVQLSTMSPPTTVVGVCGG